MLQKKDRVEEPEPEPRSKRGRKKKEPSPAPPPKKRKKEKTSYVEEDDEEEVKCSLYSIFRIKHDYHRKISDKTLGSLFSV